MKEQTTSPTPAPTCLATGLEHAGRHTIELGKPGHVSGAIAIALYRHGLEFATLRNETPATILHEGGEPVSAEEFATRLVVAFGVATVSRGKRKGHLKATKPTSTSQDDGEAVWLGLMFSVNPYKVSIGGVLWLRGFAKLLFDCASEIQLPTSYDKDRAALESMGAW